MAFPHYSSASTGRNPQQFVANTSESEEGVPADGERDGPFGFGAFPPDFRFRVMAERRPLFRAPAHLGWPAQSADPEGNTPSDGNPKSAGHLNGVGILVGNLIGRFSGKPR